MADWTTLTFPEETINPILLPTWEKIVELLIEDHHKKTFHAGVNHTLAQIRMKYWIPKGRAEVKRVLRKCNVCQKYQGPFKMPSMSPWPSHKVIRSLPFHYNGLDYFGSTIHKVRKSCRQKKCMGVLIYLCCCEGNWPGNCCWSVCWRISSSLSTCYCETGKAIVLDNAQFKLTKSSVEVAWENAIRDPDVQSHIAEQRIKWSLIVHLYG